MIRPTAAPAFLALLALLLVACSDPAVQDDTPAAAYHSFFNQLAAGNTLNALEGLAPEGALGNTFTSGSYHMMASEFETLIDLHGGVEEIVIDREDASSDDEVMIEGRIVFEDGSEVPRNIRFTREGERWVGHI